MVNIDVAKPAYYTLHKGKFLRRMAQHVDQRIHGGVSCSPKSSEWVDVNYATALSRFNCFHDPCKGQTNILEFGLIGGRQADPVKFRPAYGVLEFGLIGGRFDSLSTPGLAGDDH
jgi:hypothetical protein